MTDGAESTRTAVVLDPGAGRAYDMGRMQAVFKADGAETASGYSISEWWLAPNSAGPGAHSHAEDDVFYVLEGTMSLLVGDRWIDAPKGAFVAVPGRERSRAAIALLLPGPPFPCGPCWRAARRPR